VESSFDEGWGSAEGKVGGPAGNGAAVRRGVGNGRRGTGRAAGVQGRRTLSPTQVPSAPKVWPGQ